jgi:hypothetical protein
MREKRRREKGKEKQKKKKKKKGKAGKMNAQPQRLSIYRTLTTEHLQTTSTLTNKPNSSCSPPFLSLRVTTHFTRSESLSPLPLSSLSLLCLSPPLSLPLSHITIVTSLSLTLINTPGHTLFLRPLDLVGSSRIACSLTHSGGGLVGYRSIHSFYCRGATYPATRKAHFDEEGCRCRGGGSIDCFSQIRSASSSSDRQATP